jgi:hypothetical protein
MVLQSRLQQTFLPATPVAQLPQNQVFQQVPLQESWHVLASSSPHSSLRYSVSAEGKITALNIE